MGTICYRERYGDEDGERDGRECTVTKSEYRTTMLINREVSEIKVKNRESYRVTEAIKTAQVHKMKKKGKAGTYGSGRDALNNTEEIQPCLGFRILHLSFSAQ